MIFTSGAVDEDQGGDSSIYVVPCFDKVVRMGALRTYEDGTEGLPLNSVFVDWSSAKVTVDALAEVVTDVTSGLVGMHNPSRHVMLAYSESNKNKVYLR